MKKQLCLLMSAATPTHTHTLHIQINQPGLDTVMNFLVDTCRNEDLQIAETTTLDAPTRTIQDTPTLHTVNIQFPS